MAITDCACPNKERISTLQCFYTYPIPRIYERLYFFGTGRIFLTLDEHSGYWQAKIDERDEDKPTPSSLLGQYKIL